MPALTSPAVEPFARVDYDARLARLRASARRRAGLTRAARRAGKIPPLDVVLDSFGSFASADRALEGLGGYLGTVAHGFVGQTVELRFESVEGPPASVWVITAAPFLGTPFPFADVLTQTAEAA